MASVEPTASAVEPTPSPTHLIQRHTSSPTAGGAVRVIALVCSHGYHLLPRQSHPHILLHQLPLFPRPRHVHHFSTFVIMISCLRRLVIFHANTVLTPHIASQPH